MYSGEFNVCTVVSSMCVHWGVQCVYSGEFNVFTMVIAKDHVENINKAQTRLFK